MAFKHFTDFATARTVAVNPANVSYVREISTGGSILYFNNSTDIKVVEPYMEVVAKLDQK